MHTKIIEKEEKTWDEVFTEYYNPDFPDREPMKFSEREAL